jgi:hypothetical protein
MKLYNDHVAFFVAISCLILGFLPLHLVKAGFVIVEEEYSSSTCTGTPLTTALYDLGCDETNVLWSCSTRTVFQNNSCTGTAGTPEPTAKSCILDNFTQKYVKRACVEDDWYRIEKNPVTTICNVTTRFTFGK